MKKIKYELEFLINNKISWLVLLLFITSVNSAEPWNFSEKIKNGETFENIMLAGAVRIKPATDKNKIAREISGIAWDEDEQILYGISDDGYIVHMRLQINNNILQDIVVLSTHYLKDSNGQIRDAMHADAEGITLDNAENNIKGDTIINAVLDKPMRAERFSNTGEYIGTLDLPKALSDTNLAHPIEVNAIAGNMESGYYFLSKERVAYKNHLLFSGSTEPNEVPLKNNTSINIVGADYIKNDGVYFLDRNYKSMLYPIIYCIRRIDDKMVVSDIACFNSKEGWQLDNFEGITHYRDKYFLIMSDDEESLFQKTLIVMFKILN